MDADRALRAKSISSFFSTMPNTSPFYMNYVVLNTVTQGMVLTRYVPLLNYIG